MERLLHQIQEAFRKGDKLLLLLCVVATAFGCLAIASATNHQGSTRFVVTQIIAALIGIFFYGVMAAVDAEFFSEHRTALVVFNVLFLFMLIPMGTDNGTGNRSWLDIPLIPINIQPAEICKISCILITASVMVSHQNEISSLKSVMHLAGHLLFLGGLNLALSDDLGVTLIFAFIFAGMALAGGVSLFWFLIVIGAGILLTPFVWNHLANYQKLRIQIIYDPTIDPTGIGPRYHSMRSLKTLTGGGFTGQGLFNGHRTQHGALFAQHTDYIFSAIGEELGFIGCMLVTILLVLIVARCIWVGCRSQDYLRRMICFGAASALIFQISSNIGMCVGITPVIGLTLPFISYGGSSIVSLYAMLGLVSGVYARPEPTSHELYIRPPYMRKTLH